VGSSIFHLKKLGLALGIVCSSRAESAPGFQIFSIDIDLTIQGLGQLITLEKKMFHSFVTLFLERWQEIVYIIYQYVAMMRQEGPKERIYDEQKVRI